MSTIQSQSFKPPPVVECLSQDRCFGIGKKLYVPDKICTDCLKRHDLQQLHEWAKDNPNALSLVKEELDRKHRAKQNIELHGRYLCAFEDPDYEHCRWRRHDLNLRGARTDCGVVKRKGMACVKCWRRHLQKIGIVQYFTPMGLCHEETDKIAQEQNSSQQAMEDDEYDDVEGYDLLV